MTGVQTDPDHAVTQGRAGLTREQIVDTAIALVDDEGVRALSMRRLGSKMGVEAMALYRYVNGREDLLDAMVDVVSGPAEVAAGGDVQAVGGWRPYLWRLAHHMRDVALRHPHLFPLVATRHPAAPWLRPPLRNLDMVEEFLATLIDGGFTEPQAAVVYRSFASFLLGQLLLTAAQEANAADDADDEESEHGSATDLTSPMADYPTIARMSELLSAPVKEDGEFDEALEDVLESIARLAGEPHSA